MNASNNAIDLSSLLQLRVQVVEVLDVWRVSMPTGLRNFTSAENERRSIVEKLGVAFPYRALWLSDWASEDGPKWRLLAHDESLLSLDSELSKGGWAMFFSSVILARFSTPQWFLLTRLMLQLLSTFFAALMRSQLSGHGMTTMNGSS